LRVALEVEVSVTRHIVSEKGDGNGTPPGIRISYAAISLILGVVLAAASLFGFIRSADIKNLETAMAAVDQRQNNDKQEMLRRLDRMETKIDHILEARSGRSSFQTP